MYVLAQHDLGISDLTETASLGFMAGILTMGGMAIAVVDAVGATDAFVRDATGPDRVEFGELVEYLVSLTGGRARVVRLPISTCAVLYRLASSLMPETILTTDELKGLSRNRLDSAEAPLGRIGLRAWLRDSVSTIGTRFLREPRR